MKFIKLCASVALCLALSWLFAGTGYASDMLSHAEDIVRALRAADDARAAFEHAPRTSPDYLRMEQAWRQREYELEEARLRTMARDARISEHELRAMRESGRSWEDIGRSHNYKPDSLGLGKRKYNQFDGHDGPWRDHYKHKGKGKDKGHHGGHPGKGHDDHPGKGHSDKGHPGKAKGHYKGTPDGPPGQYKKNQNAQ